MLKLYIDVVAQFLSSVVFCVCCFEFCLWMAVFKRINTKAAGKIELNFSEFDSVSKIITQDEYSFRKLSLQLTIINSSLEVDSSKREVSFGEMYDQFAALGKSADRVHRVLQKVNLKSQIRKRMLLV